VICGVIDNFDGRSFVHNTDGSRIRHVLIAGTELTVCNCHMLYNIAAKNV